MKTRGWVVSIVGLFASFEIIGQNADLDNGVEKLFGEERSDAQIREATAQEHGELNGAIRVDGRLVHPTRFLARSRFAPELSQKIPARDKNVIYSIEPLDHQHIPGLVKIEVQSIGPLSKNITIEEAVSRYKDELESLRSNFAYDYVEPDYLIETDLTPTDTAFTDGTLWGLRNTGQNGGVAGVDISAPSAWDITTGSTNVIVAVIDSGIRYTHRELAENMWTNSGEIPDNNLDDDGNGYVDDIHGIDTVEGTADPFESENGSGHGTAMSGIIGAVANGGGSHVGVAWQVKIMALRFISIRTGYTSNAIECIEYAIDQGADIINASWGTYGYSQALRDAIDATHRAGILFIASSGNEAVNSDFTRHYPSSYRSSNIISIAGISRNNEIGVYSNYGIDTVDIAAPGTDISVVTSRSDTSTGSTNGTSPAAAYVSGVAVLLKSQFPNATPAELKNRILQSAISVDALDGLISTGGRIDAHESLTIRADGNLEISDLWISQEPLMSGEDVTISIVISDLAPVLNATVTAEFRAISGPPFNFTPVALLDNGSAPDEFARDAQYAGILSVPQTEEDAITLRIRVEAPGKTPAVLEENLFVSNDLFANRILIPVGSSSIRGSNANASTEPGEPSNPYLPLRNFERRTAWWTWVAPRSEVVSIHTTGSNFDTILAVYRGTAIDQLELVASNDDQFRQIFGEHSLSTRVASRVSFEAIAGVRYQIQVDGFGGKSGIVNLNYPEVEEPTGHARIVLPPSSIQAEAGDSVTFDVESTGAAPLTHQWYKNGTLISGATSRSYTIASVQLSDAGTYSVEVSNLLGGETSQSKSLTVHSNTAVPANDNFADAIELTGSIGSAIGTNSRATSETGEPNHARRSDDPTIQSVWWTWVAPSTGSIRVRSFGSDYDTTLAAYSGTAVDNLTTLAENNNASEIRSIAEHFYESYASVFFEMNKSQIMFPVEAGERYYIAVAGANAGTGSIRLDYRHTSFAHPTLLVNGSFESGNLHGWEFTEFPSTALGFPSGVRLASSRISRISYDAFGAITPDHGNMAFVNSFDSQRPGTLELSQRATLPSANMSLAFKYKAARETNSGEDRERMPNFVVRVEPVDGGDPLLNETIVTIPTGKSPWAQGNIDGPDYALRILRSLGNHAGQLVNIRFLWNVPEGLPTRGVSFFEMDNVRLIEGNRSIEGFTYSVASSDTDLSQGDHFHSLPFTEPPGIAEIGRYRSEEIRGITKFDFSDHYRDREYRNHLVQRATLRFQVLDDAGRFMGVNDSSFTGSILVEKFPPFANSPSIHNLSEYEYAGTQITTLQTTNLNALAAFDVDVTSHFNQAIASTNRALGIRFRANPLPSENSGAWSFAHFELMLEDIPPVIVHFPDANLDTSIREHLGIMGIDVPIGEGIDRDFLDHLTSINAPNSNISDLTGLESVIHLRSAILHSNQITDLSPIADLVEFEYRQDQVALQVQNNFLDISPGSPQRTIIAAIESLDPNRLVEFRPQRIIDIDADGLDDRFEQRIIDADTEDAILALSDVTSDGDFDGDGQTNLAEFRRFSDPTDSADFELAGDINWDSALNLFDLVHISNHLMGIDVIPVGADRFSFADANLDGDIDSDDRDAIIDRIMER